MEGFGLLFLLIMRERTFEITRNTRILEVAENMMAIVDFQDIRMLRDKNIKKDCKFGDDNLHRFDALGKFKKKN